jgi:hypothetical protein
MRIGDRVLYVGNRFVGYHDLDLVVSLLQGSNTVACKFPEPDRPGGFGLTTWLEIQDLILEEVPAQL